MWDSISHWKLASRNKTHKSFVVGGREALGGEEMRETSGLIGQGRPRSWWPGGRSGGRRRRSFSGNAREASITGKISFSKLVKTIVSYIKSCKTNGTTTGCRTKTNTRRKSILITPKFILQFLSEIENSSS
jgi:hypothetical protein